MSGQTVSENPAKARLPRQARGQARIDAILDAAALAIAESGLGGLSMHDLARRARTSIGSLYHFFPDRETVLAALTERHQRALRQIARDLAEIPAEAWRDASAEAAMRRLFTPFATYFSQHPDCLPVTQLVAPEPVDSMMIIRLVLDSRLPAQPAEARDRTALMLLSIGAGTLQLVSRTDPERIGFTLRELPRALGGYLATIEAEVLRDG